MTTEPKMEVDVRVGNGNRHGNFSYGSIYGNVPSQAMTTANINHMRVVRNNNINFKTPFLEVLFRKDFSMGDNSVWLGMEIRKMSKLITDNPNKVCLMSMVGARSKRLSRADNKFLIRLQNRAGFNFIRVYMKRNRGALEELDEYFDCIPEGKMLVPVLDENLKNTTFKELYSKCIKTGLPIIGFLGREIADANKRNYLFIGSRKKDNVIRIVSDLTRRTKSGMPKPILYNYLGYDVCSFTSRQTRYTLRTQPLQVIDGLRFVNVQNNRSIPWIMGDDQRLVDVVETYREYGQETVPCSICSIIRLNESFQSMHTTTSYEELGDLLEQDIRILSSAS